MSIFSRDGPSGYSKLESCNINFTLETSSGKAMTNIDIPLKQFTKKTYIAEETQKARDKLVEDIRDDLRKDCSKAAENLLVKYRQEGYNKNMGSVVATGKHIVSCEWHITDIVWERLSEKEYKKLKVVERLTGEDKNEKRI